MKQGSSPFHIRSATSNAQTGLIELHYGFSEGPWFTERIQLPPADAAQQSAAFDAAVNLLLLVAGTSYYKSQAPQTVIVEVATSEEERALVTELFDHGLREFAYVNQLPIPLVTTFQWAGGPRARKEEPPTESTIGHPLVPFGGGKDSTVVLSLLPEARPVTINGTSTHRAVAEVLGHELISVARRVDQLDELTRPDRLNGHIPITAIVSAISVALAARDNFTSVVLANEEAANEPTLISQHSNSAGRAVNHQWSKGATFEALFDRAITAAGIDIRYFSWLRTVEEPDIISLLSGQDAALDVLVSCNRAFAGRTAGADDEAPQRWCGECPKCVFTYLMLATELKPKRLRQVFGANLLDTDELEQEFARLWAPDKPLECVGERVDAANALLTVSSDPAWDDHLLVKRLRPSAEAALQLGKWAELGSDDLGLTPRPAPPAFQRRLLDATQRTTR